MYAPSTVVLERRSVPPPLPIYHPLTSERNEIRLCSIQPGDWEEQITCKLLIYRLAKPLGYRCLSYTWGDPNDRVPISLNGQAASITRNLWLALRRLRWYGQLDYFWIDALCINQGDAVEKSQQVRKMTEIFSRTQEVIVWLGESDCLGQVIGYQDKTPLDSLNSIFRTIQRPKSQGRASLEKQTTHDEETNAVGFVVALINNFASGKHLTKMGYMSKCRSCEGKGEHVHTSTYWDIAIRCLQRFSDLRWFSRTWTIQEIGLPVKAGVIIGPYNFTWNHLVSATGQLIMHWHGDRLKCGGGMTGCCNLVICGLLYHQGRILQVFCNQVQEMEGIRCRQLGDFDVPLSSLLFQFRYRKATDPRDKVFGLLGLQRVRGSSHINIRADYGKDARLVYSELTVEVFRAQSSLAILSVDLSSSIDGLPSWVPDWSTPSGGGDGDEQENLAIGRVGMSKLYDAAHGFGVPFNFDYDEQSGKLQLDGIFCDTVAKVGKAVPLTQELNAMGREILQCMDFLNAEYNGGAWYVTGCTLDEAFHRLLIGDIHSNTIMLSPQINHNQRRATASDVHNAKALLQPVLSNVKFNTHWHCDDAVEFSILGSMISNRRLFITERGYLGLGPADTTLGDRVYVLNGGCSPFVLRRKPSQFACRSQEQIFGMIGVSYVHGIMDGEATQTGNPKEKIVLI